VARSGKAVPAGCIIGLIILTIANVWILFGAWPVGPHLRDWARRHPILFASALFLYGAYLLNEARATRRRSPSSAVARTDTQWGVGMIGVALVLVAVEIARWLVRR
jgi:hypothetical protein